MGISVADNFSYLGGKPLDGRIQYATLAAMKAMADATLYEGCEAYCVATDKYYKWKSSNTVDTDTGKWREVSSGGGQTYNDFTGATASTAGAHGLVPAPSAGDEGKVLFGNGAWGALPSVDLSVLSNEAFILSATEKAVGQSTDGRLLYAKTVDCGAMPNRATKTVPHGASDVDIVELVFGRAYNSGTTLHLPKVSDLNTSQQIGLNANRTNIFLDGRSEDFSDYVGKVTLLYTKTTDSPLPAGVKFAGVTSSGEVIYKKWVTTGGAVPSGGTLLYRQALLNGKDIIYYTT